MTRTAFIGLALALASCGTPPGSRQAPDFALADMAGKPVTSASFRGKPMLLTFWATWCEPCREEMPALQALAARSGGKYTVVGVSMDDDPASAVPPFAKKHGVSFPLLAADPATVAGYAVRGLPTAFLIDSKGRIARRWVGPLDLDAVENDILNLLKRSPS